MDDGDRIPEDDGNAVENFRTLARLRTEWLRTCAEASCLDDGDRVTSLRRLADLERRITMTPAPYGAMIRVKLDVLRRQIQDGLSDPRAGLLLLASIDADLTLP